jgi:CARDB
MESTTTSTYTTETTNKNVARAAAINALATVGFIALLILGISLAIYSARYLPSAISKLGTFNGSPSNSLSVVTASSTIPFSGGQLVNATSTTALTPPQTATAAYTAPSGLDDANSAAATPANGYGPASSLPATPAAPAKPALYGLPDLSTTIIATGYLASDSTASFVAASVIPPGARPAVQFSVANDGTNSTGPWGFIAQIPTYNGSVFTSPVEQNMNPGDHIVYTLGFNEAIPGPAQTVTVVADPNNEIDESNESNNIAAAAMTITATGN